MIAGAAIIFFATDIYAVRRVLRDIHAYTYTQRERERTRGCDVLQRRKPGAVETVSKVRAHDLVQCRPC
jgi:hypothetical protein